MNYNLKKYRLFFVFLFFSALTVIMIYPLAFQLKNSILGGMGDNIYFVWLISWYQKVIFIGPRHPFFNPWMNYPEGWYLSTTDTTLASALPGVPFSLIWGPIAGYNIAILLTFVLSGFFMYLWIRHLTRSEFAGILSGTLYAFIPYHIAHFRAGHLNLSGMEWFPLFFWGLYELVSSTKKLNWRYVLLTGIALGGIAFTSMYYLYMTLLVSFIFVIVYLCFTKFTPIKQKFFWIQFAFAAIISLPFLYYSLKPFISLSSSGGLANRSVEYASLYSASPTDFILPSTDHFLFGQIVGNAFDRSLWIEGSFYITLTGLVLAVIALIKNKTSPHRWLIWTSLIVITVSFILSLGINLHWNNQDVILKIPSFLQSIFKRSETLIYLPSYWLFLHLPYYDKMRALMRFGVFVVIFIPVLAGIGWAQISQRFSSSRRWKFSLAILFLVIFEIYPGSFALDLTQPHPRQVDFWLAKQPDEGAVVQMPFIDSTQPSQLYYTLTYKKPFLGGFFNANAPEQYLNAEPTMEKFPDQKSIELLRKLQAKNIVVDGSAYPNFPDTQQKMEKLGLVLLTQQEDQYVYTFSQP